MRHLVGADGAPPLACSPAQAPALSWEARRTVVLLAFHLDLHCLFCHPCLCIPLSFLLLSRR